MRLWSLHPRYLDARGLVALWRESLLAQAVLRGETRGYKHHPQLERFRAQRDPGAAIATYLAQVQAEAARRGYGFDASRIGKPRRQRVAIAVTRGQLEYEWQHLRSKLAVRDRERMSSLARVVRPRAHPCFRVIPGTIEAWERP